METLEIRVPIVRAESRPDGVAIVRSTTRQRAGAELLLPHLPLRMGESVLARFRQGRPTGRAPVSLSATFTCEERDCSWDGSGHGATIREVWRTELLGQATGGPTGAGTVTGRWSVQLPTGLPPNSWAFDHQVSWRLRVRIHAPGWHDVTHDFYLPVVQAGVGSTGFSAA